MLSRGMILLAAAAIIAVCHGEEKELQWMVRVVTGDKRFAGTDADVFIQLIGTKGQSRNIELDDDGNNFEREDVDIFRFQTKDIGTPTALRVWHDDSGVGSGWHLSRIELTSVGFDSVGTYEFNCECWLDTDEHDGKIHRTLPVSTTNWKAWVHTSNIDSAGTDDNVLIIVYGDKGMTRKIPLNYERDDFERGHTNSFVLNTVDIGTPNKIRVVTEADDDWHLDKIELEDMNGAAKYTFDCDCWLGKAGQTVKDILVTEDLS